ncbi:MAG: competence type IV pilus ATPase ComGA [Vagococcus sp.]|uniref:competence type IV pilus ATPase ComGA n=1 Tax=Vagococcus sp. TaxID=1933889 RepID=UPI002FCC58F1
MDVKKRVRQLLKQGFKHLASDLYIFPNQTKYDLSFRFHHDIEIYESISMEEGEKIILYLKYLAGMDIAEKRKTQVGSTSIKLGKKSYRIRLSSVGDYLNRETLVVRFLQDNRGKNKLNYVLDKQFEALEKSVQVPGLYLFSGPTGAGKSTTMYQLATSLNRNKNKQIITIEDPVEIENTEFLQFQVNNKIDLSYQELVKVCLRHRPDILIIGEIRDQETAKMVVRAALTGHMVFSTIHATNKESVLIRLKEFGIPEVELIQSLRGVIYQELVPVISKEKYAVLYDWSINEVITNWEENLQEAVEKERITKETSLYYKAFLQ